MWSSRDVWKSSHIWSGRGYSRLVVPTLKGFLWDPMSEKGCPLVDLPGMETRVRRSAREYIRRIVSDGSGKEVPPSEEKVKGCCPVFSKGTYRRNAAWRSKGIAPCQPWRRCDCCHSRALICRVSRKHRGRLKSARSVLKVPEVALTSFARSDVLTTRYRFGVDSQIATIY